MEFWPARVTEIPTMIAGVEGKARRELGLKVMQPAARDLMGEQPREQAKRE
jgi:hypothetical protein